MAFYHNVPETKKKHNYSDHGSWDDEGQHYRDGNKGSGTSTSEKRNSDMAGRDRKPFRRTSEQKRSVLQNRAETRQYNNIRRDNTDRTTLQSSERHYSDYEYTDKQHDIKTTESVSENEENYILCGRNPIREALKNSRDIEKLLVQRGELTGSAKQIVQIAKEKKIMVQEADKARLDEIAPHHQGLIAIASAYRYSTLEEILRTSEERNEDPFLIILDGITDPHNLGAIIRTAECSGAHGIIIPQHRSVGLTPSAVKASAGAVEHVKVAKVTNINRTIEELQKNNIWVYALTMNGKDYESVEFKGGTAIVIGAEGEGISSLTEKKCDQAVSLPLKGKIESLNASVAAGIIMYRVLSVKRK